MKNMIINLFKKEEWKPQPSNAQVCIDFLSTLYKFGIHTDATCSTSWGTLSMTYAPIESFIVRNF